MSRLSDQCIEVEQRFGELLEEMTNEQAIEHIRKEYSVSHAFACAALLKQWNDDDDKACNIERKVNWHQHYSKHWS
jgi:hypothetical protein